MPNVNTVLCSAKLFEQKQADENEIFSYLLNEKTEFILSIEMKCPIPGFLLINIGWDELG